MKKIHQLLVFIVLGLFFSPPLFAEYAWQGFTISHTIHKENIKVTTTIEVEVEYYINRLLGYSWGPELGREWKKEVEIKGVRSDVKIVDDQNNAYYFTIGKGQWNSNYAGLQQYLFSAQYANHDLKVILPEILELLYGNKNMKQIEAEYPIHELFVAIKKTYDFVSTGIKIYVAWYSSGELTLQAVLTTILGIIESVLIDKVINIIGFEQGKAEIKTFLKEDDDLKKYLIDMGNVVANGIITAIHGVNHHFQFPVCYIKT